MSLCMSNKMSNKKLKNEENHLWSIMNPDMLEERRKGIAKENPFAFTFVMV